MKIKHGMTRTRPRRIRCNMRWRCDNPNTPYYKYYGGRGISYCSRWSDFSNFWEDMKESYAEGLTIDRINNDDDYSKENCRWTGKEQQSNNRRGVSKKDVHTYKKYYYLKY